MHSRLALLLAWLSSATARAEPPAPENDAEVFRYVEPVGAYPIRALIETLGILGLGATQYFVNHPSNPDWDYDYTWDDFRTKISGSGYSLDTNKFDTNYLTHPGSGTLYYWAARSNRLSILESFGYALSASTTWEIFGEFREHASVNDLLITPIAGLALGESTLQLGAFFDRSCATTSNYVLGAMFGPFKTVHDAVDGAQRLRDTECDRFGFTRRGSHEFRFSVGEAVVLTAAGSDAPPFAETDVAVRTRVIALSRYGREGHDVRTFSDGNWSELWLRTGFIEDRWSHFNLGGRAVPMGLHIRDLASYPGEAEAIGHELLFGLSIGAEYFVHRYDGGAQASSDRFFAIYAPGVSVRYVHRAPGLRLELELTTSATFGGAEALALSEYLKTHDRDTLTSIAQANGYNHVAGMTLVPRVRLITGRLDAGIEADATQLWAIRGLDHEPDVHSHVAVAEALRRAAAWVAVGPLVANLWLRTWGAALQRWGSIGEVHALRTELRLGLSADAVF